MTYNRIVSDVTEVVELIRHFNQYATDGPFLTTIAYARNWYAMKGSDGKWLFGPAKYVGYLGSLEKAFENEAHDGRLIEAALKEWFEPVGEGHAQEAELRTALRRFVADKGKSLHPMAKIHVLKRDMPDLMPVRPQGLQQSWRITASPEILGGKPCIRGIRIRVADILEMLAHGASRSDILEDFPYLEDGDITAALEYAMGTVDHRLIKAA